MAPESSPMEDQDAKMEDELNSPFIVRVMAEGDLERLISIDAKSYGHVRRPYFEEKFAVCLRDPGNNTSLAAESDGQVIGFLLGQLFFGEFGIPVTRAVLHTLGVHPDFAHRRVAHHLLAQYRKNMVALRVEALHTLVDWDRLEMIGFLKSMGFRLSHELDLVWDTIRHPFQAGHSNTEVTKKPCRPPAGGISRGNARPRPRAPKKTTSWWLGWTANRRGSWWARSSRESSASTQCVA